MRKHEQPKIQTADDDASFQGAAELDAQQGDPAASKPKDILDDLDRLRVPQNRRPVGVKQVVMTVPLRKPTKQEWFQTRSGQDARFSAYLLTLKREGLQARQREETYLVTAEVAESLAPGEVVEVCILQAVNAQGTGFLWPVRVPDQDGLGSAWHDTAQSAAELSQTAWTRMVANMSVGAYDVFAAPGQLGNPVWPQQDFRKLLALALKGRVIDSPDHEVLQRLRGERS